MSFAKDHSTEQILALLENGMARLKAERCRVLIKPVNIGTSLIKPDGGRVRAYRISEFSKDAKGNQISEDELCWSYESQVIACRNEMRVNESKQNFIALSDYCRKMLQTHRLFMIRACVKRDLELSVVLDELAKQRNKRQRELAALPPLKLGSS